MRAARRPVALVIVALLLSVAAAALWWRSQVEAPAAGTLAELARVPLVAPDGRPTTLGALAPAGRPAVVTFWASWCVPCLAEQRELVALRARHPATALTVVAIDMEGDPPPAGAQARFLDASGGRALTQALGDKVAWRAVTGSGLVALPRSFGFAADGHPVLSLTGLPKAAGGLVSALARAGLPH